MKKYPNRQVRCEEHGLMNRHVVACLNLLRWGCLGSPSTAPHV
ncbi:MAG: hypothetical protein ACTSUS_05235 [Candidatus Freyarchaeota archaeon]